MVRSLRFFRGLRVLVFLRCIYMDAYDVRVMTRICFGWMVPAITDENTMPELYNFNYPLCSNPFCECFWRGGFGA